MITSAELVAEVRNLAAESPDFVYGNQEGAEGYCSYFGCTNGNESGQACIVGQALANLDVDMERLRVYEKSGIGKEIASALKEGDVKIKYSAKDAKWLGDVQYYQDMSNTWSEAVEKADKGMRPWM